MILMELRRVRPYLRTSEGVPYNQGSNRSQLCSYPSSYAWTWSFLRRVSAVPAPPQSDAFDTFHVLGPPQHQCKVPHVKGLIEAAADEVSPTHVWEVSQDCGRKIQSWYSVVDRIGYMEMIAALSFLSFRIPWQWKSTTSLVGRMCGLCLMDCASWW